MTLPFSGPVPSIPPPAIAGTVLINAKGHKIFCGSDCTEDEWKAYQTIWNQNLKAHRDITRIRVLEGILEWTWAYAGGAFFIGILLGAGMYRYFQHL